MMKQVLFLMEKEVFLLKLKMELLKKGTIEKKVKK